MKVGPRSLPRLETDGAAGSRRIFVALWLLVHAMVFTFGFLNYQLKGPPSLSRRG